MPHLSALRDQYHNKVLYDSKGSIHFIFTHMPWKYALFWIPITSISKASLQKKILHNFIHINPFGYPSDSGRDINEHKDDDDNKWLKQILNSLFSKVVALLIFPLETWLRLGTNWFSVSKPC